MQRRRFLSGAASATLFLSAPPFGFARPARALADAPKFFISFAAQGAWDMTCLADPKGGWPHNRHYAPGDILSVAGTNLTYAPASLAAGVPVPYQTGAEGNQQDFFQKFGQDLLVLRGVDTQTNSHDIGPRHVFSGNIRVGNPAHGALLAAVHEETIGATLPMSFLSTGGFDNTALLLPPSRVGNVAAFKDLAQPYRPSAQGTNQARFFPTEVEALVKARQQTRATRLQGSALLPQARSTMEALDRARSAESGFGPLYDVLQTLPALTGADASNLLIPKAQIAIAAMAAGQCVSANLSLGGFDTHQNHDANHVPRMQQLLDAVDYTRRTMEEMGLWSDTVLMIGSDFSRTTYNGEETSTVDGKDHWPITHLLFMGKGIDGGRVVGQTDYGDNGDGTFAKGPRASKVKLNNGVLEVAADPEDPAADFLRPPDVMRSLRTLFAIDNHAISQRFPVGDSGFGTLPIF